MAEVVQIRDQRFKKRSPWGVWGLSLLTLGVYYLVWHYKINDEARRYLRDRSIRPGMSLLAVTLGLLLFVPPLVSVYRTGERIQRMQRNAGLQQQVEPILGLVAYLVYLLNLVYYQSGLNRIWDAYRHAGTQPQVTTPASLE